MSDRLYKSLGAFWLAAFAVFLIAAASSVIAYAPRPLFWTLIGALAVMIAAGAVMIGALARGAPAARTSRAATQDTC